MQEKLNRRISRREFLARAVTVGAGVGMLACGSGSESIVEPAQTSPPSPEVNQKLAPQEKRILSYAQEVLRPEFMPQTLDVMIVEPYEGRDDQKLYRTGGRTQQGINVVLLYLESVKSNRFKEDGLPLDITLSVYYQGNFNAEPVKIQELFDRHFIKASQIGQSSLDNFPVPIGGTIGSAWETVWDNQNRTKDSRWFLKFETKDSQGNVVPRFVVSATKIYKDNPLYEKNTAFERS